MIRNTESTGAADDVESTGGALVTRRFGDGRERHVSENICTAVPADRHFEGRHEAVPIAGLLALVCTHFLNGISIVLTGFLNRQSVSIDVRCSGELSGTRC